MLQILIVNLLFSHYFQVNRSNSHSVIIKGVQMDLSGKYRCEVSTDAPKFYTKVESGFLNVARE